MSALPEIVKDLQYSLDGLKARAEKLKEGIDAQRAAAAKDEAELATVKAAIHDYEDAIVAVQKVKKK